MSGFSPEWLAMREPVDHSARDKALQAELKARFAHLDAIHVVDLGCGSGSNLRALAQSLPQRQKWRLIDYDPALLDAARVALATWADQSRRAGDILSMTKDGKQIEVEFTQADLNGDFTPVLDGVQLATATAFFDLASAQWIDRFCAALAERHLSLFATLTYDGIEVWRPPHEADADILAAFHAHQRTDKGFGIAAGPNATQVLRLELEKHGYAVETARSPWRLDHQNRPLIAALANGIAGAAAETGRVDPQMIDAWRDARAIASSCEIGHADLFGVPNNP